MSLFDTGVRPAIDEYLLNESKKVRDYGEMWSASSAFYCMRKNIFERLKVPHVEQDGDARKQRVFTSGHIFHEWIQGITKNSGLSVEQESELIDERIMVKGHFDDLILIDGKKIVYDYKTQNSRAFSYKRPEMSHYHRGQLGTYMYMLRKTHPDITEGRILKISKDDLRMNEEQLIWTPELEKEIVGYWSTLNGYWKNKKIPKCTCADFEGGFLAKEKWNPFYYEGEPCSLAYYTKCKEEGLLK